jgi:predicted permease
MNDIVSKIIPVIAIFFLGYLLKRLHLLKKEDADLFLKLAFYVAIPAFILLSVANIKLSTNIIFLPIISSAIILITFGISFIIGKQFGLNRSSFGVFLVGTMIMNVGFAYPFIIAAYGNEGLARASIFDFANALITFTFTFYLACKYGKNKKSQSVTKKILYSIPIWALFIALLINFTKFSIPTVGVNFLQTLGNLTIPLVMISLGIYFNPKIVKFWPLASMIFIRMFIGFLLGLFFVYLFRLQGLDRLIVLICASAPIGYNTLTFSSMENLDKEFAASVISYSILIGLILIPILIFFLK